MKEILSYLRAIVNVILLQLLKYQSFVKITVQNLSIHSKKNGKHHFIDNTFLENEENLKIYATATA